MMTTTEMAVSLPHSDLELEALLPGEPERLLRGLAGQMHGSALCADQDLGHMEEQLLRGGHEVFRQMLEKGRNSKPSKWWSAWRESRFQRLRWRGKHASRASEPSQGERRWTGK